jgi:hypothetical protein
MQSLNTLIFDANARAANVSHATHEQEDDQNHEDEAQPPAGVIAPAAAIRPCGQSAQRHQQQNNQKYGDHVTFDPPANTEAGFFPPHSFKRQKPKRTIESKV